MGKSRAKIDDLGGHFNKVLNVQGHGDAAFSAQGVAYEALTLSKLPNYTVGGTIHFITNNQVGFTTDPTEGRSTKYSSDIVKSFGIPVIHVNAYSPEDVVRVSKFAVRYNKKFNKDIMLDMIAFRKYGHNEVDEPSFTQPAMYSKIDSMDSVATNYKKHLLSTKDVQDKTIDNIVNKFQEHCEAEF